MKKFTTFIDLTKAFYMIIYDMVSKKESLNILCLDVPVCITQVFIYSNIFAYIYKLSLKGKKVTWAAFTKTEPI